MTRPTPRPRDAYALFLPMQTRWNDNDQYGHLFNGIYAELFDGALNEWLLARDMLGLVPGTPRVVIAENGCAYFREVRYPDRLEIGIRLDRLGNTSAVIGMGMFLAGQADERAQARFVVVRVEAENHRPVAWDARARVELQGLAAG